MKRIIIAAFLFGMLFQERYQLSIGFDKGLNGAYGDRKWNSFNLGLGVFL